MWREGFDLLRWGVNQLPANWTACGWLFESYCWLAARAYGEEMQRELRLRGEVQS